MNIKNIFAGALIATAMVSCSDIAENERLIYVEPETASRNVLIEDFTGQRCVNCPEATRTIHEIQKVYGENTVIAVAIHSGPFGYAGNAANIGLMNQTGVAYWNKWFDNTTPQPTAMINRGTPTSDYQNWSEDIAKAMQKSTDVVLESTTSYDEATRELTINTSALATAGKSANLQLWIIEDGIVAMQQDGQTLNREYVHNHVFRDAVNGLWGEPITFTEKAVETTHTYTLPENWNEKNVSVVTFVYNDAEGVMQVIKTKATE